MLQSVYIRDGVSRYDIFKRWQTAVEEGFRGMGIAAQQVVPHEPIPGDPDGQLSLGFNLTRRWSTANRHEYHLAWLVDNPIFHADIFMPQLSGLPVNHERCLVACVDHYWAAFASRLYGNLTVEILPHAASTTTVATMNDWSKRPIEIALFGSIEPPETLLADLQQSSGQLWPWLVQVINGYREMSERPPLFSFLFNCIQGLGIQPEQGLLMMNAFFPTMDSYFRCLDRLDLLRSIRHQTVHVFGMGAWHDLSLPKNVIIHEELNYNDVLATLRQTRILLNHTPTLRGGAHERIFDGLLAGCRVVTTPSDFLAREFRNSGGLCFYDRQQYGAIDRILETELNRQDMPTRQRDAQQRVLNRHTMAQRCRQIQALVTQRWPEAFGQRQQEPAGVLS